MVARQLPITHPYKLSDHGYILYVCAATRFYWLCAYHTTFRPNILCRRPPKQGQSLRQIKKKTLLKLRVRNVPTSAGRCGGCDLPNWLRFVYYYSIREPSGWLWPLNPWPPLLPLTTSPKKRYYCVCVCVFAQL